MSRFIHRFKAKNEHGLHSPFLFDFYTKGLKLNIPKDDLNLISDYRKFLATNYDKLLVRSPKGEKSTQQIGRIYIKEACGKTHGKIIFKIARYFQSKSILELGSGFGVSTTYLAVGNPEAKIMNIDICQARTQLAEQQLKPKLLLNKLGFVVGNVLDQVNRLPDLSFDLIHSDIPHLGPDLLKLAREIELKIHNESVWVINHIRSDKETLAAFNQLQKLPWVKVSLDFYDYAIVFFRKEMSKEAHLLRL